MALPLQTEKGYAIGPAVNFVYLCSTICINVWFIPMIKNRKIIEHKKICTTLYIYSSYNYRCYNTKNLSSSYFNNNSGISNSFHNVSYPLKILI